MVLLDGEPFHVVLTAMHADHFADTFGSDTLHDVRAVDALRILAKSAAILLKGKRNKYVAFGRHNRIVYNTFFRLEQNRLYLLSCYRCTKRHWIENYERYEQQ
ncbi:MAG: hypothetical protein AAF944_03805 [Bacteroidota bacterium]